MRRCLHAFCSIFFLASNAADFENRADSTTDAGRLVLGIFFVLITRFLLPILREIVVFRQFSRAFRATTRDLFLYGV